MHLCTRLWGKYLLIKSFFDSNRVQQTVLAIQKWSSLWLFSYDIIQCFVIWYKRNILVPVLWVIRQYAPIQSITIVFLHPVIYSYACLFITMESYKIAEEFPKRDFMCRQMTNFSVSAKMYNSIWRIIMINILGWWWQ